MAWSKTIFFEITFEKYSSKKKKNENNIILYFKSIKNQFLQHKNFLLFTIHDAVNKLLLK